MVGARRNEPRYAARSSSSCRTVFGFLASLGLPCAAESPRAASQRNPTTSTKATSQAAAMSVKTQGGSSMSCLRCNARAGAVTNTPRAAKRLGLARVHRIFSSPQDPPAFNPTNR